MPINAVPVLIADVATTTAQTLLAVPALPGDKGPGAFVRGEGGGSERTRANKRALLNINRPGATAAAQLGVYGFDLPDALSGQPLGNAFAATGTVPVASKVFKPTASIAFGGTATFDASDIPALTGVAVGSSGGAGAVATLSFATVSAAGVPTNLWLAAFQGRLLRYGNNPAAGTPTAPPEVTFTVGANTGIVTIYVGAVGTWAGVTPFTANSQFGPDLVVYFCPTPSEILAPGTNTAVNTGIRSRDVIFATNDANAQAAGRTLITLNHLAE